MGNMISGVALSPNAELIEIKNKDFDGPMLFKEGIFIRVPTKDTAQILGLFPIEKKRYIQRVRNHNKTSNEIIVSFSTDSINQIKQILSENNISSDIYFVNLPLWCPNSDKQRNECLQYWPMNNIIAVPKLPIDPISMHSSIFEKILNDKSVIIKSPNSVKVISSAKSDCIHCDGNIHHGVMSALGKASKTAVKSDSYLCTGLDVYCYYEPCIMCTMAMVHSRVERLFFAMENPDFGGILSQAQVHSNPKINHRFRAFKLKM